MQAADNTKIELLESFIDINDDAEPGSKIGDIMMDHHLTRIRHNGVIIEAKVLYCSVSVTYPDGLRIKYTKYDKCGHVAKAYFGGEKIKMYLDCGIIAKTDAVTLYKSRCGCYCADYTDGTFKCAATAELGPYTCELSKDVDVEILTIRNGEGVVFFDMPEGFAPTIRIGDNITLDCTDLALEENPW